MNNTELMNLAINFIPHNSKVVNIDVKENIFRGDDVEEVIVEYIFRAGEYTMILGKEFNEWYVKEVFDSFENSSYGMRGEKKPLKSTTTTLKTPIKVVPKEELIGNLAKQDLIGGGVSVPFPHYDTSGEAQKSYKGHKGDTVLECIDGYNVIERGKPTKVCVVERNVNENGKGVKALYLTVQTLDGTFKDETKLSKYGVDPNVGLFDITANGVQDILVSMQSGTSGGYYIYYVYSYINNKLTKIFDSLQFSNDVKYDVNYLDNYRVQIKGGIMNYEYFIDIEQRDPLYLEKLYDDCKLKKPTKGSVSGIVNLYPVTINNNNIFQLHFISRILGVDVDDDLAGLIYVIGWTDKGFAVIEQRVVIRGNAKEDDYGLSKINPNFTILPDYIPKIQQDDNK